MKTIIISAITILGITSCGKSDVECRACLTKSTTERQSGISNTLLVSETEESFEDCDYSTDEGISEEITYENIEGTNYTIVTKTTTCN